tara:strand:- start:1187 stop:1438 length:252 start_codon:yes stop_codon:yes gene_type:complete
MNTVRQAPSSSVKSVATTLVANTARRRLLISNSTAALAYVNFTTTAGASGSHHLKLAIGENLLIEAYDGPATAGSAVVFTEFI